MGLSLEVGIYASLGDDAEGREFYDGQFAAVNAALRAAGLPEHHEPRMLEASKLWSCDLLGYSGLHYLRRIAAHLDSSGTLPPPGSPDAHTDPVSERFYQLSAQSTGFFARFFRRRSGFGRAYDHLLLHSDAEGYYVPIPFGPVLVADDRTIAGGMVGSSHRLMEECRRLAEALGMPPGLDAEGDELWDAAEHQGKGRERWQRYGVESFTCARLLRAAERSIAARAAIVFC
jgi:hypothetical protein